MELSGCGTALVTPFRADGGLDEPALVRLVEWQIDSGIELLVACGTTGEASTLSEAELVRVVETVVEAAAGRVPVIAGCTHNATSEAVARAKRLARTPGLFGLMSANPYYSKPGQEGQYRHFRAVAEATELPLLLYNIPPRMAANLEPATVLRLAADVPNILGVKESSGNLVQITELATQAPAGLRIFAGDDVLALPTLALGAVGLISVASNAIPAEVARMVSAAVSGDWATARAINRRYFALMQAMFWEPSPAPIKALLALLGHGEDHLRLPMVPVTAATRRRIEALAAELGLLAEAAAAARLG